MQYELQPQNGRKSFYGKATVTVLPGGTKELYSYNIRVLSIDPEGKLHRHWDTNKPSTTTMSHIKSFISQELSEIDGERFNARRYMALELE